MMSRHRSARGVFKQPQCRQVKLSVMRRTQALETSNHVWNLRHNRLPPHLYLPKKQTSKHRSYKSGVWKHRTEQMRVEATVLDIQ
jgi:hypothetical protein